MEVNPTVLRKLINKVIQEKELNVKESQSTRERFGSNH